MVSGARVSQGRLAARYRVAFVLIVTALVAVSLNAVIDAVATAAGAPSDYGPLALPAYALFTVVGIAVGWLGWVLVQRRAREPRRVLTVLVPVVVLVTFVPDILLLVFRFIPGTTASAVIALMLMHLVVAGLAVPAYALATRILRTDETT